MLSDRCLSCLSVCLSVCNVAVLCSNGWMDQDETWQGHICCGQMAAWIKMPLGMEVNLGPGVVVLDRDLAGPPQEGGGAPQIFSPCLLWPNGWMDQDGTWHGSRLSPGDFVLDARPSPLPQKGRAPNFRPMSIAAKRLHGSRCHLVRR